MFPQPAFNFLKNNRIAWANVDARGKKSSVISVGGRFAEIKSGLLPISVIYSYTSSLVYIANISGGGITIVNPITLQKQGFIDVISPFGFAEDRSSRQRLYVCSSLPAGQLIGIDPLITHAITTTTPVDAYPLNALSYSDYIIVSNFGSGSVSVISAVNHSLVASITGIGQPYVSVYCPSNGFIYIASRSTGRVFLINPSTWSIHTSILLVGGCIGVAYSSDHNCIYVTNTDTGTVSVINCSSNSVVGTISIGGRPREIILNPYDGHLYVTNRLFPYISVINPNTITVVGTVKIGATSSGIAYSPSGNSIFATSTEIGSVFVIPPNSF